MCEARRRRPRWRASHLDAGTTLMMEAPMRVAIGGIVQESNSFSPVAGSWLHFPTGHLLRGADVLTERAQTRTEVGGALDLAGRENVTLVPLLGATTSASAGPMRGDVFAALRDELVQRLRDALPVDGVLLVMHGAMAAEGFADATGEVLHAARAAIDPKLPLVATLDLHANVTPAMVAHANALVAYHTAPHIDLYETGQRGLRLLAATVRGAARPTAALRRLPMLLPAENGRTTEGPYAEVMARALALLNEPGVLDVSVCSVQPWLDVADAACTVLVYTDNDPALAARYADELADLFWARKTRFEVTLAPTAATIARALASERGPFVLADSADAPSSGAPGDSTAVLEHLLAAQPQRLCLHNIVDPVAVAELWQAGTGATATLRVGAGSGAPFYRPIEVTGRVRLLSDGDFTNKGLGFQGVVFRRGRTAVLEIGQIALVVMERAVIQWDPELYRSLGLEPRDAQIVVVKSPAAFRAAYEPLAAEVVIVDAPGVCSPNLRALPFRQVQRPIYPLDDVADWRLER
jgi:microcystin degradation protein MlrC